MTLKRWMLSRRRLDYTLLALVFALLAIANPMAKWIIVFFVGAGMNVGLSGHRTWRYAPVGLTVAISAYSLWAIGLSLARGEPVIANRELNYNLVQFALIFLPLGTALVPRPLDAMILGARIGILAMLVLTMADYVLDPGRVGLGINEAIFAFLAAVTGLIARLRSAKPRRLLPEGRFWFYLTAVPVLLSGTRSAWLLYALVLVLDLLSFGRDWRLDRWRAAAMAGAALVAVAVAAVPAGTYIEQRFARAVTEIETYRATGLATGSVDTRLAMWTAAAEVIADHPVIGVGGLDRMAAVAARTPENGAIVARYEHLHNLFVDAALASGLVGLVLLIAIFAVFLRSLLAWTRDRRLKETTGAFLFLVVSFGSFQGILLNEWMIISIFSFMLIVLSALKRDRMLPTARVHT